MSTFKKINLTVNAETGALIDPLDGSKLGTANLPDFYLGETSVLCISFVDSDLNAYPFAIDDSFELSIDKDFVHTVNGVEDPLMVYSGNSMFNISGDWESTALTNGKISARLNCNTVGFAQKIGNSESVLGWIEIKRYPAGLTDASIILRNKCVALNSVKASEGSPSSASPDYYTADQIDALMLEAESQVLTLDNTVPFTPTEDYHPATKKYLDDNAGSGGVSVQSNLFVNGNFSIWQRSTDDTAVTTTRKYVADRFAVRAVAGTLAHVLKSTTVPTGSRSKYSLELNGAAGVTTVTIDQRIAAMNVPKSTVYFSAYIYNGSGAAFTPTLYVSTPSASDNWTTSTVRNGAGSGESLQECADSAWMKVYWAADISGYTDIANGLEFKLAIPSGSLVSGDTVRVADVILTYGSSFIEPIVKTYSQEYMDCLHYYWRNTSASAFGAYSLYASAAGQGASAAMSYTCIMRIAPTGTIIGTWVASNCAQPTVSATNTTTFAINATASAAGRVSFYNPADTGLSFDAEL